MILHLKENMSRSGINSVTLAEMIGVSKVTVSYWINGKVFPDSDKLERIASALGIEVWELFKEPSSPQERETNSALAACPHCGKSLTIKIE